jgi:hypothetical protein
MFDNIGEKECIDMRFVATYWIINAFQRHKNNYILYRMSQSFGQFNPALTQAVKRIANGESEAVFFSPHAFDREVERGFNHDSVWSCLRRGKVYGPELIDGKVRANVLHLGLHIRVAIGGLELSQGSDWSDLCSIVVCSVMEI